MFYKTHEFFYVLNNKMFCSNNQYDVLGPVFKSGLPWVTTKFKRNPPIARFSSFEIFFSEILSASMVVLISEVLKETEV